MSRRETEREDLMREATALVERAEISVHGWSKPVVVGFRRDGSASFFFGGDPVYQFNAANELRRAYCSGLLYKAERGRLVALRRERSEAEVALVRTELSAEATAGMLTALRSRLDTLHNALRGGSFDLVGQIPAGADVIARVCDWLAALPAVISIAQGAGLR